jgi:hypothetical protein
MAVGPVVGRAYIEIHADSKPFAKELGVEIEAIAKSAETGQKSRSAGQSVARGVIRGASRTMRREGRGIFSTLLDDLAGRRGTVFGAFTRAGFRLGKDFAGALTGGAQAGFKGGFGLLNALGSSIGNVGGKGGLGAFVGAAIAGLVAGAIVLVQQLVGLTNALFLIPGALSAIALSVIPVVVAFHGFGTAISALLSGDLQGFNDALKTLTPSAKKVALEFQKLLPLFHDLHTIAQESFFKGIVGDFKRLGDALGPVFKSGFEDVATAAGKIADSFLKLFSSPQGQTFFKNMFTLADVFVEAIGPGIVSLVNGLMSVASGSTDELSNIFVGIGQGLAEFGLWLDRISKNGKLQDFFNSMTKAFDALMMVSGIVWTLASALFGSNPEDLERNKIVLELLGGVIKQLSDFLKSDLGKHGLTALFIILVAIAGVFSGILQLILSIAGALEWAGEKLGAFYAFLTGKPAPAKPVFIPGAPVPPNIKYQPAPGGGKGHADGAIVSSPEVARLAERGPEVVIPLTNPRRAMALMAQSGLNELAGGGTGDVNVYIGNEKIDAHVERVQAKGFNSFARNVKYTRRPVGVGV